MLGLEKVAALVFTLALAGGGYGIGTLVTEAHSVNEDSSAPVQDDHALPNLLEDLSPEEERCRTGERCPLVFIGLFVRWGLLEPPRRNRSLPEGAVTLPPSEIVEGVPILDDPQDGRFPMVPWDGFLQVTRGGVRLVRTVLFESGGEYRNGADDFIYARNNRLTLEWRSSTTSHWDGVLAVLAIPRMNDPVPHVTLHTDQWSHIFEAPELLGLHRRVPVDRMGHEIEINGFAVNMDREHGEVAVFRMMIRWGFLDNRTRAEDPAPSLPRDGWNGLDGRDCPATPWDGFLATTKGRIGDAAPVLFEGGGRYCLGEDDRLYPRENPLVVEWRSSTLPHWDGVMAVIAVPIGAVQQAHITVHTDQWSRIFDARDLVDLHLRVPTDRLGHEIEIRSQLVTP